MLSKTRVNYLRDQYRAVYDLLMSHTGSILVCDDDPLVHTALKNQLKSKYKLRSAYHADEALLILSQTDIDLMILDIQMRTEKEGIQYLPKFKENNPELEIIINSGRTDLELIKEAIKNGASDYINKDLESFELMHTLDLAFEKHWLKKKSSQQTFEVIVQQKRNIELVGQSSWTRQISQKIEKIKNSNVHVLILGETGTGKEVIARQLRKILPDGSPEPFVAVDSATIQSSMAESILFGHEKGSFTGADRMMKGIFEQAHGGIIYFDEIGNMSLEIQSKLLRVLQEKEIKRIGGQKTIPLDFRVVCATNKNLQQMILDGTFKDDLLQRINVIPLQTVPLKDRSEDIVPLIQHFVRQLPSPKNQLTFMESALQALQLYSWPGNIRELSNVISYVATLVDSTEVEACDLPPQIQDTLRKKSTSPDHSFSSQNTTFYEKVTTFEKSILTEEYSRHQGNISKLAQSLGMDRSHLYSKLKEFGIHQTRTGSKN